MWKRYEAKGKISLFLALRARFWFHVECPAMNLKEISPFKDFFDPIGELVVAASMLETHISSTIQFVLCISAEDRSIIIERIRSIEQRIDMFEMIARRRIRDPNSNLTSWLDNIVDDLRNAVKHRNNIVHGPWNDFDPLTGTATKIKFKQKIEYKVQQYKYTTEEIRNISALNLSLMQRMAMFTGYLSHQEPTGAAPPPSPGKLMPAFLLSQS